ncbi:MAG: hypothetical protein AAGG51_09045 [Cyanobacteria bacterium P01_G01_bin.54]
MKYQYTVRVVDFSKVEAECNTLGQQDWELATAYPSARADCCNQSVATVVLVFKKPT